ncbi:helix-turn-helix transcriptional regulator [Methyloversatilis discipulorum]|uniref:helix-turn-helix transcriptional regulator n=1 Tax=Methyloversatilis discipulorum TaxID=1119528 RepID=UPI001A3660D1|nr:helix-turn-helix transcriptional regulator [Methyloversatilis discipulorum]MBL8467980.1 helix-turn-helix transcriptional regulator [Methyloversatilis discipulorum]
MSSPELADARLSALITHYYDAALDSSLWPGTATRTAQALDSTSTVIKLHGDGAQVDLLECTDNLVVAERDRAWAEDWHRRDLWVERSVAHGLSRVITDEDLVTPEEQARSGFYQEWLRHLDIHHMLGAVFQAADGVIGVLGIHRTREAGTYTEIERSKVALLLPHLQRALRLGRRLSALSQAHAAALQALDRVDTGVVVVDERCRVMLSSAMADALLRGNTELAVHGGCLVLRQPALRDALSARVRAAVDVAQGEPGDAGAALCVPRMGRLPLVLEIAPLRPSLSVFGDQGPAALMFIRDPEAPADLEKLRALFDLTRTEAAVAAALAQGRSLEGIASVLGIGLATVRSHLKRILAKTGTHRQAEVVALLARCV